MGGRHWWYGLRWACIRGVEGAGGGWKELEEQRPLHVKLIGGLKQGVTSGISQEIISLLTDRCGTEI